MTRTTFTLSASALLTLLLSGCGGSGGSSNGPPPPVAPAGLLKPVANAAELEASLKAGFTVVQPGQEGGIAALSGGDAAAEFTGTYALEQNVDEFDSVKYDGDHLYVAPARGHFGCCFILETDAVAPPPVERSIRILKTDPVTAAATEVSEIPLEDGVSVQGLYAVDDTLVALTAESYFGSYGDSWAAVSIWAPEQTGLRIYDTSDIGTPELRFSATLDGHFIESRRVGNTVYLITRYSPFIDGIVPWVTTPAEADGNRAVLSGIPLDELLPEITVDGVSRQLVDPARCYVTNEETDQIGYPVITSITAVPIDNPMGFQTTCYNEDAYGTYVSENAVYLTQSRYETDRSSTRVHKFTLTGSAPSYAGSGEVDGVVWTGGQSDFRLNEHNGNLRLLTSTFDRSATDFVDHQLFILREAAGAPELEIVSSLPNANRPDEIGKPNEQLFGVRFLGDRVYAVTFEQIDPLYTIDLSDPADPFIAGELEVAGVSDFLHPVTDDLLLGLGRGAGGGIKLELFDVSDIERPLSVGSDEIGGPGSRSEATWNRHAFTYLPGANGTDRLAIPTDVTAADGSFTVVESGLRLYEIRDTATPALASLVPAGSLLPNTQSMYPLRSRSVFHDDAVYYIRDDEVFSALWGSAGIVNGPH